MPQRKTKKTNPLLKRTMSVFSVFGAVIIVLGVVFVSYQAREATQTQSQARYEELAGEHDRVPEPPAPPIETHFANSRPESQEQTSDDSASNSPEHEEISDFFEESSEFNEIGYTEKETDSGSSQESNNNSNSSSSSGGKDKDKDKSEPDFAAAPMNCREYKLVQIYFRDNKGYVRDVPIDANGTPVWSSAPDYWNFVNLNSDGDPTAFPGSGMVNAIHWDINPASSQFRQIIVRDNVFYTNLIQTDRGFIDWTRRYKNDWSVGKWLNVNGFELPKGHVVTSYDRYTIEKGQYPYNRLERVEDLHASDDAYRLTYLSNYDYSKFITNTVKTENRTFQYLFNLRERATAIPGSGSITASASFVDPKQHRYYQNWIRGNVRYTRESPIYNGNIDFSQATEIKQEEDLNTNPNALQGSGPVHAMTSYVTCASL